MTRYIFDARWAPEVVHVNDYMVPHPDGEWMRVNDHERECRERERRAALWGAEEALLHDSRGHPSPVEQVVQDALRRYPEQLDAALGAARRVK